MKHKKDKLIPSVIDEKVPGDLYDRLEYDELHHGVIRIDEHIDDCTTTDYMRKIGLIDGIVS